MTTERLERSFIEAGLPVRAARMLAQRFAFHAAEIERQSEIIDELVRRLAAKEDR